MRVDEEAPKTKHSDAKAVDAADNASPSSLPGCRHMRPSAGSDDTGDGDADTYSSFTLTVISASSQRGLCGVVVQQQRRMQTASTVRVVCQFRCVMGSCGPRPAHTLYVYIHTYILVIMKTCIRVQ